jgi:hypothetical protein
LIGSILTKVQQRIQTSLTNKDREEGSNELADRVTRDIMLKLRQACIAGSTFYNFQEDLDRATATATGQPSTTSFAPPASGQGPSNRPGADAGGGGNAGGGPGQGSAGGPPQTSAALQSASDRQVSCPPSISSLAIAEKIRLYYILNYYKEDSKAVNKHDNISQESLDAVFYSDLAKENPIFEDTEIMEASSPQDYKKLALHDANGVRRAKCVLGDYLSWINSQATERGKSRKGIGYYIDLKNNWSSKSGCFIEVSEKKIGPSEKNIDPSQNPSDDPSKNCVEKEAWERMRCSLDNNNEMFVYDVEPKHLAQRVSALTQIERMYALAFGAKVKAAGEGGEASGAARISAERQMDEIENHAIVLPLGEGASSVQRHGPHTISFGWVIAPQIGSDGRRLQIDGDYALSAVISAPSWWGSVKATYTMCWIDPSAIHSVERLNGLWASERIATICDQHNDARSADAPKAGAQSPIMAILDRWGSVLDHWAKPPSDVSANSSSASHMTEDLIRLPNGATDIARKLGFDFLAEPHLDNRKLPEQLIAGYPGDLLLQGDRLWRSTDVFLDAQRADSIRVLPDMKGIVAHFNCVLPFISGPGAPPPTVSVVTSEGLATLPVPAPRALTEEQSGHVNIIDRCAEVAEKGAWQGDKTAEQAAAKR